jgi:hypothetical protein
VPLPSFELGYRAYEARTMANTVPAASIGATSLDRTEFFRSSGGREHQLHQGCVVLILVGVEEQTLESVHDALRLL